MEQNEFEELDVPATQAIHLGKLQRKILKMCMNEGPMRQRTLTEKINAEYGTEYSQQTVRKSALSLHERKEVPFERKDTGNYIYYGVSNMSTAKKMFGKHYERW